MLLETIIFKQIAKPKGRYFWTWAGWLLDGRRYWWVSVGLQNKSIETVPLVILVVVSRKLTDVPWVTVKVMFGLMELAC